MREPTGVEHGLEVVVVSGLSGAGRSTAAKVLEDLGWFVVDNLPPELIATMVELGARAQGDITRIAVVMDVRSRAFSARSANGGCTVKKKNSVTMTMSTSVMIVVITASRRKTERSTERCPTVVMPLLPSARSLCRGRCE